VHERIFEKDRGDLRTLGFGITEMYFYGTSAIRVYLVIALNNEHDPLKGPGKAPNSHRFKKNIQ
jgi:hypothetical protein